MAVMECASRATFVIGAANGAPCDFKWRMNASLLPPHLCGPKIVRLSSVHTPRTAILGGVRSNIKLSGAYCIACCVKFFAVLRYLSARQVAWKCTFHLFISTAKLSVSLKATRISWTCKHSLNMVTWNFKHVLLTSSGNLVDFIDV